MLVLHGALGLFDEVGYVVAAIAAVLAIASFIVHLVTARNDEPVTEPVHIDQ